MCYNDDMKYYLTLIVALILLFLIGLPTFAQSNAEERQAREAAETHNEAIETAEERMEDAVRRARMDYARTAIRAKQAYIRDLQAARRTALQADNADAAQAIVEEINRVQEQIEELTQIVRNNGRTAEEVAAEAEADTSFQAYTGVWNVMRPDHPEGRDGRTIAVFPDGRVAIVSFSEQRGSDEGHVYQAELKNGMMVIVMDQMTTWNANGLGYVFSQTNGGIICREYTILNNGNLNRELGHQHTIPNSQRSDITDEIAAMFPSNEEENEENENNEEEEGNTFFGIPLK